VEISSVIKMGKTGEEIYEDIVFIYMVCACEKIIHLTAIISKSIFSFWRSNRTPKNTNKSHKPYIKKLFLLILILEK
jgi:hypothetical protein